MTQDKSVVKRKPIQPGERNGRLVAVKLVGQNPWKAALWQFRCDCGNRDYVTRPDQVRRGIILSCGCYRNERMGEQARSRATHGHSRNGKLTSEYNSWRNMLARCNDPNNDKYENYGGRGITVCERWSDFRNFLFDMGAKPSPRYTIDRRDVNGNYEPKNCCWSSPKTQSRNKTNNRIVAFRGREMSLAEACELSGISRNVVDGRLQRGWTIEKALSEPVMIYTPRT
jgi:hypothetical protein